MLDARAPLASAAASAAAVLLSAAVWLAASMVYDAMPPSKGYDAIPPSRRYEAGHQDEGDKDRLAGMLQTHHNGRWGSICEEEFEDPDAQVACRRLGLLHASFVEWSHSPDDSRRHRRYLTTTTVTTTMSWANASPPFGIPRAEDQVCESHTADEEVPKATTSADDDGCDLDGGDDGPAVRIGLLASFGVILVFSVAAAAKKRRMETEKAQGDEASSDDKGEVANKSVAIKISESNEASAEDNDLVAVDSIRSDLDFGLSSDDLDIDLGKKGMAATKALSILPSPSWARGEIRLDVDEEDSECEENSDWENGPAGADSSWTGTWTRTAVSDCESVFQHAPSEKSTEGCDAVEVRLTVGSDRSAPPAMAWEQSVAATLSV